jgi:penicillin-binding protein 1A
LSVIEIRRLRPWLLGGLLLAIAFAAFRIAAGVAERRIAAGIESASQRLGVRVQYDDLHVGVWPPVRLKGLAIDLPGQLTMRIDSLSASPRFRGPRGFGLLGRVSIENATVILPAEVEVILKTTIWEVDPAGSLTLQAPVGGLLLSTGVGPRGRVFDIKAAGLELDALGALSVEGSRSTTLGLLSGDAHAEGDPRSDFQATWRMTAFGGATSGSVLVLPGKGEPKHQIQASMKDLDFGRVLGSLGIESLEPDSLGTLSGTISASGHLRDPSKLEVIQKITFKAPKKHPPEVARLQGPFVLEVTTNSGQAKAINVSPGASNFIHLSEVPPLFTRALLIAEDAAFYSHPGIDLTEIGKVIAANMEEGGPVRGGSTITQQLAKNLFLSREKSLQRKLRELSYSFLLESILGKSRILEIYLNVIEWGPGLYGLRPAARHYFAKEPSELTPREIAFLVCLIPGPVKYQKSFAGGELRRGFETLVNNLLVKLRSVDALTEEEYQAALVEPLELRGLFKTPDEGGDIAVIQ